MSSHKPEQREIVKPRGAQTVGCTHCDSPGGVKTYANQACLPLKQRVVCIDWCIHQIVSALNAGGVETVASCCGHGTQRGRIDLADGRILWIENPPTVEIATVGLTLNEAVTVVRETEKRSVRENPLGHEAPQG